MAVTDVTAPGGFLSARPQLPYAYLDVQKCCEFDASAL